MACVGAFTSLFAAVIGITQDDIKRVLAFSTLSQLGYMMLALGVATAEHPLGYTASMFHLFTHAFFKALLFLGAGRGDSRRPHQRHLGDGRAGQEDAGHARDVPGRDAGHRGHLAASRASSRRTRFWRRRWRSGHYGHLRRRVWSSPA